MHVARGRQGICRGRQHGLIGVLVGQWIDQLERLRHGLARERAGLLRAAIAHQHGVALAAFQRQHRGHQMRDEA
ncbi:hypothetical protein SDC9_143041 [bioreactor metagenome]|uniref:Uncharacterized protein n=1 Tax=bioreactor metagenome TaxID=1076179 RepID=A0A645E2X8_9ZZZZ